MLFLYSMLLMLMKFPCLVMNEVALSTSQVLLTGIGDTPCYFDMLCYGSSITYKIPSSDISGDQNFCRYCHTVNFCPNYHVSLVTTLGYLRIGRNVRDTSPSSITQTDVTAFFTVGMIWCYKEIHLQQAINVIKKLKHGSIITGCWNIHWCVHLLYHQ